MTDWVEIPRTAKRGSRGPFTPAEVSVTSLRSPRSDRCWLRIKIGREVAAKLAWGGGTLLRARWAKGGAQLMLDISPPGHTDGYPLKADKAGNAFAIGLTALPDWLPIGPHDQKLAPWQSGASQLVLTLPASFYAVKEAVKVA